MLQSQQRVYKTVWTTDNVVSQELRLLALGFFDMTEQGSVVVRVEARANSKSAKTFPVMFKKH